MKKLISIAQLCLAAAMLLTAGSLPAVAGTAPADKGRAAAEKAYEKTNRPAESERLFRSEAVEAEIVRVKKALTNARLAWMFENCFPNTLDTTVHFRKDTDGMDDTFVYTGDIHSPPVGPSLKALAYGSRIRHLNCRLMTPASIRRRCSSRLASCT